MSTKSFSTMPLALDLSSTLVMGWILPVATTLLAMSPRVTLASLLGSILLPLPRATATITASRTTTTTGMVHNHHLFFRLRCVVTQYAPLLRLIHPQFDI